MSVGGFVHSAWTNGSRLSFQNPRPKPTQMCSLRRLALLVSLGVSLLVPASAGAASYDPTGLRLQSSSLLVLALQLVRDANFNSASHRGPRLVLPGTG